MSFVLGYHVTGAFLQTLCINSGGRSASMWLPNPFYSQALFAHMKNHPLDQLYDMCAPGSNSCDNFSQLKRIYLASVCSWNLKWSLTQGHLALTLSVHSGIPWVSELLDCKSHKGKDFSCAVLYFQCLEKCLSYSRCPINMNKWMNESLKQGSDRHFLFFFLPVLIRC